MCFSLSENLKKALERAISASNTSNHNTAVYEFDIEIKPKKNQENNSAELNFSA